MANSYTFKDKTFNVGDTIALTYKLKEGDKERQQKFEGILIKIKGQDASTRTFTTRKMTRSGIGVERIIPLSSPYLLDVKLVKKGAYTKSKLYFIRNRPEREIRHRIYRHK